MNVKESKMSFNDFCYKILDKMYEPRLSFENQCTGYKLLRKMVEKDITPATEEEYYRWKNNPTKEELFSKPDIKYLNFLHQLIRPFVREHWDKIKKLSLN